MVAAGRASGIKSWSHCLSAHITPTLISLHWLHVPERTSLKLAVLTYRSIHSTLPSYLQSCFSRVADMTPRRRLRFSASHRLVVPPVRLSTVGKRAFPVAVANTTYLSLLIIIIVFFLAFPMDLAIIDIIWATLNMSMMMMKVSVPV